MMKTTHLLFGLLVLMGAAIVMTVVAQEVPFGQGFNHPDFPEGTIQQAPDGMERHQSVVIAAGCFGALTSMFAVVCCGLGLNTNHRDGPGARLLIIAGAVYGAIFLMVVMLYWQTLHDSSQELFGFPVATAWMLLILGPLPIFLAVLYMVMFSQWVLLPQDEEIFNDIVARRRERQR